MPSCLMYIQDAQLWDENTAITIYQTRMLFYFFRQKIFSSFPMAANLFVPLTKKAHSSAFISDHCGRQNVWGENTVPIEKLSFYSFRIK